MVCSDRISLLLKSSLTHYVFLQRGRKGPQRTKYGKSDIIMQVNVFATPREKSARACFFLLLLRAKSLQRFMFPSQLTAAASFVILHTSIPEGLHLISLFYFAPLCFSYWNPICNAT